MVDQESIDKLKNEKVKLEGLIKEEMKEELIESRKRKLNKGTEKNTPKFIPKHMKDLKKCCVCGEMNQKNQMTLAPKLKKVLLKWSHVFGQKFYKTCWKNKPCNQYICSIHWEQLRDDWEGSLPEVLEKMKKENNGSFEVVMFLNDISDSFLDQQKHSCRYCGIKKIAKEMTLVPTSEEKLMKWAKRLGEDFLNNVRAHTVNRICWSHFKYHDSKCRNADILLMTDEIMKDQLNNYELEVEDVKPEIVIKQEESESKCRYCGDSREIDGMVIVPNDRYTLGRWVKSLGAKFFKNLTIDSTNYICWDHFSLSDSMKPYYLEFLPKKTNVVKSKKEKRVKMEHKMKLPIVVIEKESKKEEDEFGIDKENKEPVSASPPQNEVCEECRYCGNVRNIGDMVLVPDNQLKLVYWVKNLGLKFADNLAKSSTNYICWSHFKLENSLKQNYMNYLPHPEPRKTSKKQSEETKNDDNDMKVCRYCGDVDQIKKMVRVPYDRSERTHFVKMLGSTFLENLIHNPINYVCWTHFNLTNRQKPLKKTSRKTKNGHNFKVCRYCGDVGKIQEMVLVPKDGLKLNRWMENLGLTFLENHENNLKNYICWSHFDSTNWQMEYSEPTNSQIEEMENEQNTDIVKHEEQDDQHPENTLVLVEDGTKPDIVKEE